MISQLKTIWFSGTTKRAFGFFLLATTIILVPGSRLVAEQPDAAAPTSTAVLELSDGDFVRGRLSAVTEDGRVEWDSDFFTRQLHFPLTSVQGMQFPPLEQDVTPEGQFVVELSNRDILFGDLLAIDEKTVRIASPSVGKLTLRRDFVRRLSRSDGGNKVHRVPTRLDEWTTSGEEHWQSEEGGYITQQAGASLFADVNLPEKAMIELELTCEQQPSETSGPQLNFAFFMGTDGKAESLDRAFSIEVWGDSIVMQRHTSLRADVASLKEKATGTLHVFVYLDQQAEKAIVYGAEGTLLAELEVPSNGFKTHSGIKLLNRSGKVHLKRIQVRGWSGVSPVSVGQEQYSIVSKGNELSGSSLSVADGELLLKMADGDKRIPLADVDVIDIPSPPHDEQPEFVAAYHDGSRITGKLVSATDRELIVASPASDGPIHISLPLLRGFSLPTPDDSETPQKIVPPEGHRSGTLTLMDTRLKGWLVEEEAAGESASCLVWKPALAESASPLRRDVYGRIIYRKLPKKTVKKPTIMNRRRIQGFAGNAFVVNAGVAIRLGGNSRSTRVSTANSAKSIGRAVHLRSGDTIPCKVIGINEKGVLIESSLTESNLIPHDKIKAVQLVLSVTIPGLTKTKRERLLTLPRMQKNSPPMHLLFSKKGDILRGTVTDLDSDKLGLNVRLDSHSVPRDRIATIVWLHEDELKDESSDVISDGDISDQPVIIQPEGGEDRLEVQVVSNSGPRFSFYADSYSKQSIHGSSDVLLNVHAEVSEMDQLFLGGFIHRAARSLPYHRWRLTHATQPKFAQASSDGDSTAESTPGTESNLVGKPAPALSLKMLEGKDFRLSDHRGHCVVLDFWATWCGPCLQVMPKVEAVVKEFADEKVALFAVNLEESPEQIKATLERRGLNVPVALDRDGVAAARYEAKAIPQTVIIGPDGNIKRVFIGSTRDFEEQLRQALTELTKPVESKY